MGVLDDCQFSKVETAQIPLSLRLAGAAVKRGIGALYRHGTGQQVGHLAGEGYAELATGRYQVDYGSGFGETRTGGLTYQGKSGTTLQYRDYERDGLWLLTALLVTVSAEPDGAAVLREVHCRHYRTQVDWVRAAAATRVKLPYGNGPRPGRLRTLDLSVWTDERYVRQVWFQQEATGAGEPVIVMRDETLELWDFGVSVADLDWSRIPRFRSVS